MLTFFQYNSAYDWLYNDISCAKRELTEAWRPLTALSKWNFKLQHAKPGQLKTVYFQLVLTLFICIEIHVVYLHFNLIAISLNIKRKQHRKLFPTWSNLVRDFIFFLKPNGREINHFKIISSVYFRILSSENCLILRHQLGSAHENVRRMNQQSNLKGTSTLTTNWC